MPVIGNLAGIGMLLGAVAIMAGITTGAKNAGLGFLVAGAFMVGLDLLLRSKDEEHMRPLFNSRAGGSVFYIPVWIIGIFPTFLGVFGLVAGISSKK